MKKKLIYILTGCLLISLSCEQEPIVLKDPAAPAAPCTECTTAVSAGTADFSKFIAIGNSFVAGMQGGALFTDGQDQSLGAIVHSQLKCATGASAVFNQPDINASLGWNLFITQPFETDFTSPILGRLLLQYGDNVSCATGAPTPLPTPQAYEEGDLEALPNPTFNPGFLYSGDKSELNNFSVPAVTLVQALIPNTGDWNNPGHPAFNPFYARFSAVPGTTTMLYDASASDPTFAMVWLGFDDFFLYAAFGADPTAAPLTSSGDFQTYFGALFGHPSMGLLTLNPTMKAVVGNYPDIFKMPHFTSVSYNPIPLDADQVSALTAGFAGYNTLLDGISANAGLLTNFGLDAAELQSRKLSWEASCTNKILMTDETLDDLGDVFNYLRSIGQIPTDEARAALVPYEQVRQTTVDDIIPLATGSILGTTGTFGAYGVNEPVGDRWVIIPTEKTEIENARVAYNAIVAGTVAAFPDNLVLADVSAAYATLVTNKAAVYNGVTITPNINPPTGIYSEDGVHPNARGYAFISRTFISAINTKFGSKIPLTCLNKYSATALPIP